MKKEKYLTRIIVPAAFLLLLGMISCDILDEEIVSGITVDAHYTTPEGFEDAVRAAYMQMRNWYGDEGGCNLTAFGTDEYTNGGHGGNHAMNQYTSAFNSDNGSVWNMWNNFYQAINTCNAVVGRAPDTDIPEAQKNIRLGEVRFLRAHYYFLLVQTFGPVFLTLEETLGVEIEAERHSEEMVYNAIVEDLEFAVDNLPVSQAEFGRITRPAAQHMLALVLLTRAQNPDVQGQANDIQRAYDLATSVINDYDRALLSDFADLYPHPFIWGPNPPAENNAEVLWSVQYTGDALLNYFPGQSGQDGAGGNRNHMYFSSWYENLNPALLPRLHKPGFGRPWQRYKPTRWGLNNFRWLPADPGELDPFDVDSRYRVSFQDVWYFDVSHTGVPEGAQAIEHNQAHLNAPGDTAIWVTHMHLTEEIVDDIFTRNAYSGNVGGDGQSQFLKVYTYHPDNVGTPWEYPENMFPALTKWDDWNREGVNFQAGERDFVVYRLGETYLIAAEALHLLGRDGEAADYINALRERALHPGVDPTLTRVNASHIDIDFILDERARELFGEQKRWFDLKRTGKLVERVQSYNDHPSAKSNIQQFHNRRPIPANQIIRTPSNFPQNPGYGAN